MEVANLLKRRDFRSFKIFVSGNACCSPLIKNVFEDSYEFKTMGLSISSQIKKSNVLVIAGAITNKNAEELRSLYDQMQKPCWVIALGACACSGGAYQPSYSVVKGLDKILPVDIYVPGCPPTVGAVMSALEKLQKKEKVAAGE